MIGLRREWQSHHDSAGVGPVYGGRVVCFAFLRSRRDVADLGRFRYARSV